MTARFLCHGFALSLFALVFSVPAAAQQGYVRQQTSSGACEYWNRRTIAFAVDRAGAPDIAGEDEFAAVINALTSWSTAVSSCSDLTFVYAGTVASARVEYLPTGANQNVIVFRPKLCSEVVPTNDACLAQNTCGNQYNCWSHNAGIVAMPTTTVNEATGEILDVDVELNLASFTFTTVNSPVCAPPNFSQTCVATDVQNTVTPSIGLAIGLGHVSNPSSTMAATTAPGELSKRTIDSATVAGVCAVYPKNRPATTCDGGAVEPPVVDGGHSDGGPSDGGQNDGGTAVVCNFETCTGCCTSDGRCELGTSPMACGTQGSRCDLCDLGEVCGAGVCHPPKTGCGCSALEPSMAVMTALITWAWLARRRRVERDAT